MRPMPHSVRRLRMNSAVVGIGLLPVSLGTGQMTTGAGRRPATGPPRDTAAVPVSVGAPAARGRGRRGYGAVMGIQAMAGPEPRTVGELRIGTYTVPTDAPESDGTLAWDATTLVVVEALA